MRCPRCHNLNHGADATCSRCGASLRADSTRDFLGVGLSTGATLDHRYEIEALIGRGGMAEVYAALDRRLQRRVALKVLGSELLRHRTARSRMETEAIALARVAHPNVVQIYNVFDHDGLLVLDLELMTGGTLITRIPAGGMPCPDALSVMSSILSGLAALHRAGLIHRDVKPANVLMTADGLPKIADLGVARDETGHRATRTGAVLGTPTYMSPEQIRAQPDQPVDPRSDIYACGIVLHEMLTGEVPFKGNSDFDVMTAQVSRTPDLTRLRARAPGPIVDAVSRALEKDPARRWQTADELREALAGTTPPVAVRSTEQAVVLEPLHQRSGAPGGRGSVGGDREAQLEAAIEALNERLITGHISEREHADTKEELVRLFEEEGAAASAPPPVVRARSAEAAVGGDREAQLEVAIEALNERLITGHISEREHADTKEELVRLFEEEGAAASAPPPVALARPAKAAGSGVDSPAAGGLGAGRDDAARGNFSLHGAVGLVLTILLCGITFIFVASRGCTHR